MKLMEIAPNHVEELANAIEKASGYMFSGDRSMQTAHLFHEYDIKRAIHFITTITQQDPVHHDNVSGNTYVWVVEQPTDPLTYVSRLTVYREGSSWIRVPKNSVGHIAIFPVTHGRYRP